MNVQPDPETQLEIIDHSLRCFAWGMVSLVPVLGLIGSPVVIYHYVRIRRRARAWPGDPARAYRRTGLTAMILGTLISMILSIVISIPLVKRVVNGW